LEVKAEKIAVNPRDNNHGNAMQAIEQPSGLAMLSSIDNGIMALAIMKQPIQIKNKKKGCDAMTTLSLRFLYVHPPQLKETAMEIATKVKPAGRIFVK